MTEHLLDTGDVSLFSRQRLVAFGRCVRCGWHPPTQGHHVDCPDFAPLPATTDPPRTPGALVGEWIGSREPVESTIRTDDARTGARATNIMIANTDTTGKVDQ